MEKELRKLEKFFHDKTLLIQEEFLDRYVVVLKDIEETKIDLIKKSFEELISCICNCDMDKCYNACNSLTTLNIQLGIPYIILIHELMQLQKIFVRYIMGNYEGNEVYQLHRFYLKLEDIIAQNYLENYIQELLSKNNRRIANLSDIYEKNIVQYYKAHLKWLSNVAKSIHQNSNEDFPQVDHSLCSFGKWLSTDGKAIIQNNSKYNEIFKQHKNLHLIAKKIKAFLSKKDFEYHIILTYLEKCEMISLSLGTELALIDNTLINSQASKDPLTGALNRQRLGQLYSSQLEISFATSQPFVIAICDLDHFKKINDTYGHLAGDAMLKAFVKVAASELRTSDLIIRYGGEEFIFILGAVKKEIALEILEKVRKSFEKFILNFDNQAIQTTVSMGMMEIDAEDTNLDFSSIEDAIEIIDKKLYKAKQTGRNKII